MLLLSLSGTGALLSQLDWFHAAGSALFLGASLLQHQSIVLLASLRVGKSGEISRSSLRNTSCLLHNVHKVLQGLYFVGICVFHLILDLKSR